MSIMNRNGFRFDLILSTKIYLSAEFCNIKYLPSVKWNAR